MIFIYIRIKYISLLTLKQFFMAGPGQQAYLATLYAEVQTFDAKAGGWQIYGNGYNNPVYRSFPTTDTQVIGISPAQVVQTAWGSVTANSVIEIFPLGLSVPGFSKKFLCDATVSTLNGLRQ